MANAVAPIRQWECMIRTDSDSWVKGQCYRDHLHDGQYLVRLSPIPPNMHQAYLDNGGHPLFGTIAMMIIEADSPDFRLILSDEVTLV